MEIDILYHQLQKKVPNLTVTRFAQQGVNFVAGIHWDGTDNKPA